MDVYVHRTVETNVILEEIRGHMVKIDKVRAFLRMVVVRRRYLQIKDKSIMIQRYIKGYSAYR